MSRYKTTIYDAISMRRWVLKLTGASKYLDTLPELPKKKKISSGLYVSYEIDKSEIGDDLIDYCTPEVISIWAVDSKGEVVHLGGIRVYHWETYWLELGENCEVDTFENWWELILKKYEKFKEATGVRKCE